MIRKDKVIGLFIIIQLLLLLLQILCGYKLLYIITTFITILALYVSRD